MPDVLMSTPPIMDVFPMTVREPTSVLPISVIPVPDLLMAVAPVTHKEPVTVVSLVDMLPMTVREVVPIVVKPTPVALIFIAPVAVTPPESVAKLVADNVVAVVAPNVVDPAVEVNPPVSVVAPAVTLNPPESVAKPVTPNVVAVVAPNVVEPAVEVNPPDSVVAPEVTLNPPESVAKPLAPNVVAVVAPAHNVPTVNACTDTLFNEVLAVAHNVPVTVTSLVETLPMTVREVPEPIVVVAVPPVLMLTAPCMSTAFNDEFPDTVSVVSETLFKTVPLLMVKLDDVKLPSTDTAPDTLRPAFKTARAFTSKSLRVVLPSTFNVVLTEVFCRTVCPATERIPLIDALPVSNFRDRRCPIMLTLPPILTLLITDKLVVETFTMVVSPATLSVPLIEVF